MSEPTKYIHRVFGVDHVVQCSDPKVAELRGYLPFEEKAKTPTSRAKTSANKAKVPANKAKTSANK